MSTAVLSGVAGAARRVQGVYAGVGGVARKVTKVYAGVNGVARLSWESSPPKPPELNPVFGENSWEEIGGAIADDRIPDSWAVGDEKEIMLINGRATTLQIYGIRHDDLPEGGKASFTLGMKHLSWWRMHMNLSNTNEGSFVASDMYAWLSGTAVMLLPADLRAIIKPVVKRTASGNLSQVIQADNLPIFLFAEIETLGTSTISSVGEGSRYEIFTKGLTSLIKHEHNGTGPAREWWLRSPNRGNSNTFATINASGNVSSVNAGMSRDMCFGLCI